MSEAPLSTGFAPISKTGGLELDYPDRLVSPPAWVGHIPFAFAIVAILRPQTLVELGVHSGNSYCALLQAVRKLGLQARCFGVDHWRGEEHSGKYGEEVYEELGAYHNSRYGQFSTLLRSSFDDALDYFPDHSVDLLHLDGFHTYEAASHDFTSWLPKMSSRGVMLLHDVNVREGGFGVWRLWREISTRYPTFEFVHSHGLGIVYVGADALPHHGYGLFSAGDEGIIQRIRDYFSRLGMSILDRYYLEEAKALLIRTTGQRDALDVEVAEMSSLRAAIAEQQQARDRESAEIFNLRAAIAEQQQARDRESAETSILRAAMAEQQQARDRQSAEMSILRAAIAEQQQARDRESAEMSILRAAIAEQQQARDRESAEMSILRAIIAEQQQALDRQSAEMAVDRARTTEQQKAITAERDELSRTVNDLHGELVSARSRAQDLEYTLKQSWIAAAQRWAAVARVSDRESLPDTTPFVRAKAKLRSLAKPARGVLARIAVGLK